MNIAVSHAIAAELLNSMHLEKAEKQRASLRPNAPFREFANEIA